MHVLVIGGGYLGTTQVAMLLTAGASNPGVYEANDEAHAVTVLEIDPRRVDALNHGGVGHEPGISEVWAAAQRHTADVGWSHEKHGVLRVLCSRKQEERAQLDLSTVDAVIVCVGTPGTTYDDLPSLDLSAVKGALMDLAEWRRGSLRDTLPVFVRSTMPPGAMDALQTLPDVGAAGLMLAHVPEFFTEGAAIEAVSDTRRIVGLPTSAGRNQTALMVLLWMRVLSFEDDASSFLNSAEMGCELSAAAEAWGVTLVDANTSALAKLGTNYALASRLTMANELAIVAGNYGADAGRVLEIVGRDARLGGRYLKPGCGWGGSCLPKDTATIAGLLKQKGVMKHRDSMAEQCVVTNELVINSWFAGEWARVVEHVHGTMSPTAGTRLVVTWLGVSFKEGTDDMRSSPPMRVFEAWMNHITVHGLPIPSIRLQDPEVSRTRIRNWLEGLFPVPRPELRGDYYLPNDRNDDGSWPLPAIADLVKSSHVVVLATGHRAYLGRNEGLLHAGVVPTPGAVLIDMRFAFSADEIAELRARGWRYVRFGDTVSNTPGSR